MLVRKRNLRFSRPGRVPDHIDQLYDSLKKKDLTRRQFRQAYKRVLSEKRSRKDLESMLLSLEIERQSRERINRRLKQ